MGFVKKIHFNKNTIALILTFLFSFFIYLYNDSLIIKTFKSFITDSYNVFSKPHNLYHDIISLKEENKLLSNKLVQLSLLNSKLINYEIENKQLRELLNFKESFNHLSLLPANIVNSNYSISMQSSIINVGSNDNIIKDLCIVNMHGYLVGKVIDVGLKTSNIQLITDNNFSVSIKIGENISIGQFKSTYGRFGILEGVLKTLDINEGDIIYTSGISEIYPPDIPVAKVISHQRKQNKLFQDVEVEILSDINNLYYVFVIQ